jgi:hypothetical protein
VVLPSTTKDGLESGEQKENTTGLNSSGGEMSGQRIRAAGTQKTERRATPVSMSTGTFPLPGFEGDAELASKTPWG